MLERYRCTRRVTNNYVNSLFNPGILNSMQLEQTEAEFKEFKPWLNYGWFHLKLYKFFQDLSRRSIETGFRQI